MVSQCCTPTQTHRALQQLLSPDVGFDLDRIPAERSQGPYRCDGLSLDQCFRDGRYLRLTPCNGRSVTSRIILWCGEMEGYAAGERSLCWSRQWPNRPGSPAPCTIQDPAPPSASHRAVSASLASPSKSSLLFPRPHLVKALSLYPTQEMKG